MSFLAPFKGLWIIRKLFCLAVYLKSIFFCFYSYYLYNYRSFMRVPGGASGKELTCHCRGGERQVGSLGREDPLEEGMATHSSILAWRISWTEEPGSSLGLQRVGPDWTTKNTQHNTIPSTVVFSLERPLDKLIYFYCKNLLKIYLSSYIPIITEVHALKKLYVTC